MLCLVGMTGMQAQLSLRVSATHPAPASMAGTGTISLSADGGVPPYAYLCTPGAYTTSTIAGIARGTYSLKVTDSNADTALYRCSIGYRAEWDQLYGSVFRNDSLMIAPGTNFGQAISKNTLAAGTDGWVEYNLQELGEIKYIGFLDSLSPSVQQPNDLDYAYYYNGSSRYLYAYAGQSYVLLETGVSGQKNLRIERVGDSVFFKIDQARVLSYHHPLAGQKPWKLKAFLVNYGGSLLENVGCSFNSLGNGLFPNYTRLVPVVVHAGSPSSADGSIRATAAQSGAYTFTWQPGSVTGAFLGSKAPGTYTVSVEDPLHHLSTNAYAVGYKVKWDHPVGCSVYGDSVVTNYGSSWGRAISKNTLRPGVNGWVEYILRDLQEIKMFGFSDSLSPLHDNISDMKYGFYWQGSSRNLYMLCNGSFQTPYEIRYLPEGTVLRIERTGDTVRFRLNGILLNSFAEPIAGQSAWKVKGVVSAYENSSILNLGCSFYEEGHTVFANYTELMPAIVHSSGLDPATGLPVADGSLKVSDRQHGHNSYRWMPGGEQDSLIVSKIPGTYSVTVEDEIATKNTLSYTIGYKAAWDSLYGCELRGDTLVVNSIPVEWGSAVTRNTLSGGSDGWIEYVLKDLDDFKFIGFLDSISPYKEDFYDIDYGFYYSLGAGMLYAIAEGNWTYFQQRPLEGSVLRVERRGEVIRFKINGVVMYSVTNPEAVQKDWKVKAVVNRAGTSSIINLGCSFAPYDAQVFQQDANCLANTNGSISINPHGATAPYTYALNNGGFSSSNSFSNLLPGTYTVDVKDATGALLKKTVTIGNCPKWLAPFSGASVNSRGDVWKTAGDSSWTNAVLFTDEPFRFAGPDFWLSFETPDTASVFMLGFRTRISDSLLLLSDSLPTISNYRLYVENSTVTVIETDNDGFYNKSEVAKAGINAGFKIRLGKSGIEYYRRPDPASAYELIYISKLVSPAPLIVEQALYKPGSRTNRIRVSSYGNTN